MADLWSGRRVAIVHLGRAAAMGEQRRVASWGSIIRALGADVLDVPVRTLAPARYPDIKAMRDVVRGRAVLETLAWKHRPVVQYLRTNAVDGVIVVTLRAHDPGFGVDVPVVLDFVDALSVAYRDRAMASSFPGSIAWRLLAATHGRVESAEHHAATTAAGVADARRLGASWVPNVITVAPTAPRARRPTHDLVFLGNLAYSPNRSALDRLSRISSLIEEERRCSVLIGGANPDAWVRDLCRRHGWTLHGPFADATTFVRCGRVAVAPLDFTAGIQNKVLEAAAAGVPQVISSAVASGLPAGAPFAVADSDEGFAAEIMRMLRTTGTSRVIDTAGRDWIRDNFSADRWAAVLEELLHHSEGEASRAK